MTQTPPQQTSGQTPDTSPADDPLARLHKMSTTAGVGVGDYVAINPLAVTAVVLGVASAAALLDPILLVVPIIALIIGIVAFVQIRKSSGTQGGLVLAILGIVAALGCAGWVGVNRITDYRVKQADREAVIAVVDAFGKDLMDGKVDDAWEKFSPTFHETFERELFRRTLNSLKAGNAVGQISTIRSNQLVIFETFPDSPDLYSQNMLFIEFLNKRDNVKFDDRYEVRLRKIPGVGWKIERLDAFFPPPKVAPPKGGTADPNAPLTAAPR